mgnify:CR=1 FL=1
MGKFVMKETKNGGVKFDLKAGNGEVIATSEAYSGDAACKSLRDDFGRNVPVFEVIGRKPLHAFGETLRVGLRAEDLERLPARDDLQRGVQRFDLFEVDVLRPVEFAGIDAFEHNFLSDSFRHRPIRINSRS